MKNLLQIDLDTDRKETVIIGKPSPFKPPTTPKGITNMVIDDMATLCEALVTLIHVAHQGGMKQSHDSLKDCIAHLKSGFADADYTAITK